MEKIAEMAKLAEVRGVLAACYDSGMLQVDSRETFDKLASAVSDNIKGAQYSVEDVVGVASALLTVPTEKTASAEKTAEEKVAANHDRAVKAALGELLLMKVAGQIEDSVFRKEADELMKQAAQLALPAGRGGPIKINNILGKPVSQKPGFAARMRTAVDPAIDWVSSGLKAEGLRGAVNDYSALQHFNKNFAPAGGQGSFMPLLQRRAPQIARDLGVYGGIAGLGLLGKGLYDHFSE